MSSGHGGTGWKAVTVEERVCAWKGSRPFWTFICLDKDFKRFGLSHRFQRVRLSSGKDPGGFVLFGRDYPPQLARPQDSN